MLSFTNLYSFLLVYSLLGFFTGGLEVFFEGSLRLISGDSWKIAAGLFVAFTFFALFKKIKLELNPFIFVFGIFLLLLSDFTLRQLTFFQWVDARIAVPALGFVFLLIFSKFEKDFILSVPFLLGLQVLISFLFLNYAEQNAIFSDDHPSFLYRLQLLKQHFPNIPFYNPEWNAGYSAREFFASGVLNFYFFTWPLIHFGPDLLQIENAHVYNYLLTYVYVFVVPWSIYFAVRIISANRRTSLIAGILALAPTISFYEWLLRYGTIGFVLSSAFCLLAIVYTYKFIDFESYQVGAIDVLALLIISYLAISWTLCSLVLLPVFFLALFKLKRILRSRNRGHFLVFCCFFALLNANWVMTFIEESKVFSFVSSSSLPGAKAEKAKDLSFGSLLGQLHDSHTKLKKVLVKVNPLLLLLFLPGLLTIQNRSFRNLIGFTIVWLLFLSTFGDLIKPQLELNRMVLPASFLMILPVASLLNWLFQQTRDEKGLLNNLTGLIVAGLLFFTPVVASACYLNQTNHSYQLYTFAPKTVSSLSEAIEKHGGSGRTFFVGFILHELGAQAFDTQDGGHIAPLTTFSKKPIYASNFYHVYWNTVDPIPALYRKRRSKGIEEFLDLLNTTSVVTFKREWARYCKKRPEIYKEVFRSGRFRLFERKTETKGYFLEGEGELSVLNDGFVIQPRTEKVTLRFRFLPKLKSIFRDKVKISGVFAFDEDIGANRTQRVDFISLEFDKILLKRGEKVHISYHPEKIS